MKVSAIPAQITTVEDRIAGNLNLTQLILLAIPLFLSAVIFFLLPPIGSYALYKLILVTILTLCLSTLAIRVRDKLLIDIIKVRVRYDLRAHTYVYREQPLPDTEIELEYRLSKPYQPQTSFYRATELTAKAKLGGQKLLADSKYSVAFQSKSGGLIVKVSTTQAQL